MKNFKKFCMDRKFKLLAILAPVILMLVIYMINGVYPIGQRGVALVDSFHQYVPFFGELSDKLKTGGSLFYSWNGGLGFNFFGMMSYYLMCPLNLLLLLVPKTQILTFFSLLIVIKVALASFNFHFYITRKLGRDGYSFVAFSIAYALCGWTIGYNWNIMWLDSLLMLPLLIYALEKLIDEGKWLRYAVLLGVTIMVNFYIAFEICIFLVLYFLVYAIGKSDFNIKDFVFKGLKFAGGSLLGGGLSAVILIPVYNALQNVYSASTAFPTEIKFYNNFLDIFARFFPFSQPTKLSGLPNLYSGLFVVMAVVLYAFYKKATTKKRVLNLVLVGFLIFSTNFKILNYIWHGFHFPNDLPARFSFIISFLMITMACEVYCHISEFKQWQIVTAYGISLGTIALSFLFGGDKGENFFVYIVATLLISVYFLLLFIAWDRDRVGERFRKAATVLIAVEVGAHACFGLLTNGTMNRGQYVEKIPAAEAAQVKIALEEDGGKNFYRSELNTFNGRNNATWLGFRSLSLFSSTMNEELQKNIDRYGFFSAANKFSYVGATPVTDALFGIKYVMSYTKDPFRSFEEMSQLDEKAYLFRNPYALSLAYMVHEEYLEASEGISNPFVYQNEIIKSYTHVDKDIFTPMGEAKLVSDQDAQYSSQYKYSYTLKEDVPVKLEIDVPEGNKYYAYYEAKDFNALNVYDKNDKKTSYKDVRGHIIELNEGNNTLEFTAGKDKEKGSVLLIPVKFNPDAFEEAYKTLKGREMTVLEFDDTYVKGIIDCDGKGLLMTSIPYDKGWRAYINGQEVDVLTKTGSFIYLEPVKGRLTIEFKYTAPGFFAGLWISLISLLIILAVVGVKLYKYKIYGRMKRI